MKQAVKMIAAGAGLGVIAWLAYRASQGAAVDTASGEASPIFNGVNDLIDVAYQVGAGDGDMQISNNGLNAIKGFEGFKANVYNDVAGYPTIGYGHKLTTAERVARLKTVTEDQAAALLASDVQEAVSIVNGAVKVALNQNQFDALVSFTYNVGGGNFRKSTLAKLLNAGDYAGAAAQFSQWKFAGGVVSLGLETRRIAEAALFSTTGYA